MRSVVLTIRPRPFIEASQAIGMASFRVLWRHVLPNSLPPVIVVTTVSAATAILAEAGLSFLGLGVQPPTATWGNVISGWPGLHHFEPPHLRVRGPLHRDHGGRAEPARRRAPRHPRSADAPLHEQPDAVNAPERNVGAARAGAAGSEFGAGPGGRLNGRPGAGGAGVRHVRARVRPGAAGGGAAHRVPRRGRHHHGGRRSGRCGGSGRDARGGRRSRAPGRP